MLKGHEKGIAGENVRELKHKGLSERDAVLTSMKNDKKLLNKSKAKLVGPDMPKEDYPYGLKLDLNHEVLTKLGHKTLPKVGSHMKVHAHAKVVGSSEHNRDGEGPRRSVDLQITHMKLHPMGSKVTEEDGGDDEKFS